MCRAAVGPDDYVLRYLPEMIRGREVVVVKTGGRVVAMAGVTECADRALWIGQMRAHPRFRRRGFARAILEDAANRARREHRPALRLWTSERNTVSRQLFETTGFREIGRFTRVQAPAIRSGRGGRRGLKVEHRAVEGRRGPPRDAAAAGVYPGWLRSAMRRAGHRYIAYWWHFVPLSRPLLTAIARRGELVEADGVGLLMWEEPGDPAAYATILVGGRRALLTARLAAGVRARRRVELFLPNDRRILHWAREAGYSPAPWGRHAVLYERRVRSRPRPR